MGFDSVNRARLHARNLSCCRKKHISAGGAHAKDTP